MAKCKHCKKVLADYHCSKCKILLNIKKCPIYVNHCKKCDICIYSQKNKNYHCNKCNNCHESHVECEKLNSNCPICLENVKNASPHSTGATVINNTFKLNCCGNIMHTGCFFNTNFETCPFCRKNIT